MADTMVIGDLSVTIPEGWGAFRPISDAGNAVLELRPTPGSSTEVIVLSPPVHDPAVELETALEEFIAGHNDGREIIAIFPEEPVTGSTDGALPFVARHCFSLGLEGDPWLGMYWMFQAGDAPQGLVATAADKDRYEVLLERLGPFVDSLERAR